MFALLMGLGIAFLIAVCILVYHRYYKSRIYLKGVLCKYGAGGWYAIRVFFINHRTQTKGLIMEVNAQIDQVFLAEWPAPKDKGGNPAPVEQLEFFTDDESLSTNRQATQAEVDAYNAQFPEEGDGSEKRIPVENIPYTGRIATSNKVGATQVGIRADKKIGEAVEKIESRLTVTNLPGEAVGFGDARVTAPVDNLETEG